MVLVIHNREPEGDFFHVEVDKIRIAQGKLEGRWYVLEGERVTDKEEEIAKICAGRYVKEMNKEVCFKLLAISRYASLCKDLLRDNCLKSLGDPKVKEALSEMFNMSKVTEGFLNELKMIAEGAKEILK